MEIKYVMVLAIEIIYSVVPNCLHLMFRLTSAAYFYSDHKKYVHYN